MLSASPYFSSEPAMNCHPAPARTPTSVTVGRHLPPTRSLRTARRGFTILELVIVVAIVLILTAVGIVQSQEMVPRFRTRRAAITFSSKADERISDPLVAQSTISILCS